MHMAHECPINNFAYTFIFGIKDLSYYHSMVYEKHIFCKENRYLHKYRVSLLYVEANYLENM